MTNAMLNELGLKALTKLFMTWAAKDPHGMFTDHHGKQTSRKEFFLEVKNRTPYGVEAIKLTGWPVQVG